MTRSGVYICPRCGFLRAALRVVGASALRIELDPKRQRIVCPREGADMVPVLGADLAKRLP